MHTNLDVLLSPADVSAFSEKELGGTACVVFDVLRATTSMLTGLANGAAAFVPVNDIPEALELRRHHPDALLAGERNGLRILAGQAEGTGFDLGNSPREFTREVVSNKVVIISTTNGTRALRACDGAQLILAAGFVNMQATAEHLLSGNQERIVIVCSGTGEQLAYEDALAAGSLSDLILASDRDITPSDAALLAIQSYRQSLPDVGASLCQSTNARRLLANPDLADDVAFCLQRDVFEFAAILDSNGLLRAVPAQSRA